MIEMLVTLKSGKKHWRTVEEISLDAALDAMRTEFGGNCIKVVELFTHPNPAFVGLRIFFV